MTNGNEDRPSGLIAQQQERIANKQREIDDLQAAVNQHIGDLARLQAEADRSPTPAVLAEIQATSEAVRRLRAQLPAPGRDYQPRLGTELEQAKVELERLREQRQHLARQIHAAEATQARYGDVLPEITESCQAVWRRLDAKGWPEQLSQQEFLKVLVWATRTQNEIGSLDGLRLRLAALGDDDIPLPDFEGEARQRLWQMAGLTGVPARG